MIEPGRHFTQWLEPRHPVVEQAACYLVPAARDFHRELQELREGDEGKMPAVPAPLVWVQMYRSGGYAMRQVQKKLEAEPDLAFRMIDQALQFYRTVPKGPDTVKRKASMDIRKLRQVSTEWEKAAAWGVLYLWFGQKVVLPCRLYLNESPSRLMRQARRGDHDALEKLLTVDRTVLADPAVAAHWHELMLKGDGHTQQRLIRAMSRKPGREIPEKTTRAMAAAMLQLIAEAVGEPLTTPELRDGFDQHARDVSKGKQRRDFALPDGEEAFQKAVKTQRERLISWTGADDVLPVLQFAVGNSPHRQDFDRKRAELLQFRADLKKWYTVPGIKAWASRCWCYAKRLPRQLRRLVVSGLRRW